MTILDFVFLKLPTLKTWLDKCLKSPVTLETWLGKCLKSSVSENPSTGNMVNVPTNC